MNTIKDTTISKLFRQVVKQGFVPIFVADDRNVEIQLAACAEAGLNVIEYTQRRSDAPEMIPAILRKNPDVKILVGSTLDDDGVVNALRRNHPQLRTFDELAELGASGFVSRMSFSEKTCARWQDKKLLIPCAGTVNEAYRQFTAGAHIIKVVKPDYEVVKQLNTTPAFGFCPLFVTGGMLLETIPDAMKDGVLCVGTGFDAIMKDAAALDDAAYHDELVKRLLALRDCVVSNREKRFPGLLEILDQDDWLNHLPFALPENIYA